jgi:hypothetical protein
MKVIKYNDKMDQLEVRNFSVAMVGAAINIGENKFCMSEQEREKGEFWMPADAQVTVDEVKVVDNRLDINNDGKVDEKDASLAGEVLADAAKKAKKSRRKAPKARGI